MTYSIYLFVCGLKDTVNSVNKDLGGTCGKIERFCSGGKPERLEENHEKS
jgi:hypothetical protein